MPHIVFLGIAAAFGYGAWAVPAQAPPRRCRSGSANRPPSTDGEASWDDLQPVDQLGLELGYRLIALVDKNRQGDLLTRIKGVRRKFAQEVGFLPPPCMCATTWNSSPAATASPCAACHRGRRRGLPGHVLAINPGWHHHTPHRHGHHRPAFGLPAHWIDERQKEAAQMAGFTVVDSETVMATHLSHLMQVQASKLLSRTETQQLVEHVSKLAPKLIEEVVPKMVSIAVFQKVLQLLLDESVHIRDIRTIIESLAEHAGTVSDPAELARGCALRCHRPSCSRSTAPTEAQRDRH
jgi:flagellar biosynthesis protein FlhA